MTTESQGKPFRSRYRFMNKRQRRSLMQRRANLRRIDDGGDSLPEQPVGNDGGEEDPRIRRALDGEKQAISDEDPILTPVLSGGYNTTLRRDVQEYNEEIPEVIVVIDSTESLAGGIMLRSVTAAPAPGAFASGHVRRVTMTTDGGAGADYQSIAPQFDYLGTGYNSIYFDTVGDYADIQSDGAQWIVQTLSGAYMV